ncbi:MAG: hypothetical protein ACO1RT_11680, partial [Planctomycetaceae bacterium]
WGTKAEKRIPRRVVEEAEFELAREQLATQSPGAPAPMSAAPQVLPAAQWEPPVQAIDGEAGAPGSGVEAVAALPATWPDPTGLIPDPPSPTPPPAVPQSRPVLSHTRIYRGDDEYFTDRLADYVGNEDDARQGGWQSYLNRSNDFIRFCCHLHLTEMLESRGGLDQSDLILRWPISRY